jgi:ABC-type polysaccharide/polyol phosphate export permease
MAEPLVLRGQPASWREWAVDWRSRGPLLWMLVGKDFRTRYKRASLGVLWAVVVPLVQAVILAFVFSQVLNFSSDKGFGAFILSGVVVWSYFAGTQVAAVTAIVDGAGIADKVWFPRAMLTLVPCLSNLIGFVISLALILPVLPVLDISLGRRILLLVPAIVVLVLFSTALALVLSALHVYFRDVKFLLHATLLVWIYATPVLYPRQFLGRLEPWADLNPMTGVVSLFHRALIGDVGPLLRPVSVTVVTTAVLLVAGIEGHRRHDRLFVDQL